MKRHEENDFLLVVDSMLATKREAARRLTRTVHVNPALDLSKVVFS